MFLLCTCVLRAEVFTIDFNRGTVNGTKINTDIEAEGVTPHDYCSEGADFFSLHSVTQNCRYDTNGCGIRIGTGGGTGIFVISLDGPMEVSKIVVYASKTAKDTKSTLTFYAANEKILTYENDKLRAYSEESPASENYRLADIVLDRSFRDLNFQVPKNDLVMLHRVEIHTFDEDGIHSPVENLDEMGVFCNLAGQRTSKPSHGIYIKNGKKYVVK